MHPVDRSRIERSEIGHQYLSRNNLFIFFVFYRKISDGKSGQRMIDIRYQIDLPEFFLQPTEDFFPFRPFPLFPK